MTLLGTLLYDHHTNTRIFWLFGIPIHNMVVDQLTVLPVVNTQPVLLIHVQAAGNIVSQIVVFEA
jgi:hypothetical protein